MSLSLFRVENAYDNQKRFRYKISQDVLECSKKVFSLRDFCADKITLMISNEEMKPLIFKTITSFSEYKSIAEHSEVAQCLFDGKYKGEPLSICVDHDLSMINVICEEGLIAELVQMLS